MHVAYNRHNDANKNLKIKNKLFNSLEQNKMNVGPSPLFVDTDLSPIKGSFSSKQRLVSPFSRPVDTTPSAKEVEGPRYLGHGGYGCVVWPAIEFRGLSIPDPTQFVSKIAADAATEYDIAKTVENLVGSSVGIFPYGPLHCNVTAKDLGPNRKLILRNCTSVLVPVGDRKSVSFAEFFTSRFPESKKKLYEPKREERLRSLVGPPSLRRQMSMGALEDLMGGSSCSSIEYRPMRLSVLRAGQKPDLCAITYPRYDIDLSKDFKRLMETRNVMDRDVQQYIQMIHKDAKVKLNVLHRNYIFHMDIKSPNLSLVNAPTEPSIRFGDWGLTLVLTPGSSNFATELTLLRNQTITYHQYYERFNPDLYGTYIDKERVFRVMENPDASVNQVIQSLAIINIWCLLYAFVEVIEKRYLIKELKEIQKLIEMI